MRPSLSDRGHDRLQSRANVRHHYDIGNDLYKTFLDEGMNYSCAFFARPDMTLREAQLNKIRTSIERLDIRPGMRVLDIGCGWGETCMTIAAETGAAFVTGVTLSENQLALARERAARMDTPPDFRLEDYRDHAATHQGAYDRIISIGMFEHVGHDSYHDYFAAVRRQLAPGGRALIHSIMNADEHIGTVAKLRSVWLQRYIFPGGELPDLQEMLDVAKAERMVPAVAPYLQPSFYYGETLRHWRANFIRAAHHPDSGLDTAKYDARFQRMWIFYLSMCEAMFEGCGFQVGQVVFKAQ
jgi:cyclopropane-fatty-acyl-phospholipid synthase